MSDFDYPTMNDYPTMQRHDNFPYQNFFQSNPISENVQIATKSAVYVQPRKIVTLNTHGEDKQWIGEFQMPCSTILPKSNYYKRTGGIILPP